MRSLIVFDLVPDQPPPLDFRIVNHGSQFTFTPLTLRAEDWWSDNVENGARVGGLYPVDHGNADAILQGITQAKLSA